MAFFVDHSMLYFLHQICEELKSNVFSTHTLLGNPLFILPSNVSHESKLANCLSNFEINAMVPAIHSERLDCYLELLKYILSFNFAPEIVSLRFHEFITQFNSNFIKRELLKCYQHIVSYSYVSKCRSYSYNLNQNYVSQAENSLSVSDLYTMNNQEQFALPFAMLACFVEILQKYYLLKHFQNSMDCNYLSNYKFHSCHINEKYISIIQKSYVSAPDFLVRNMLQVLTISCETLNAIKYNEIKLFSGENFQSYLRRNMDYSNLNEIYFNCFRIQRNNFQTLKCFAEREIKDSSCANYLCNKLMTTEFKSSLILNSMIDNCKFLFSGKNIDASVEIENRRDSESESDSLETMDPISDSAISHCFFSINDLDDAFDYEVNNGESNWIYFIEDDKSLDSQCNSKENAKELEKNSLDQFYSVSPGYVNPCFEDDMFLPLESEKIRLVNDCWQKSMKDVKEHPRSNKKVSFLPFPELVTIYTIDTQDEFDVEDESYILDQIRFRRRINEAEAILSPYLSQQHREKVMTNSLGNC